MAAKRRDGNAPSGKALEGRATRKTRLNTHLEPPFALPGCVFCVAGDHSLPLVTAMIEAVLKHGSTVGGDRPARIGRTYALSDASFALTPG